jgi:periplasmic protein TonB
MTTTTKESAPAPPLAQCSTPAAEKSGPSSRTDATGVEIPVVVHASHYSLAGREASKALPPLHEQTRTVVVFPQGSVVRLSASLSVGELVVLTNQQTGADILCRVTNFKSQQGVQNYVDLEFTQRVPGFWGECFAADRSAGTESPASESAAPILGTAPALLAPVQQPTSLSLSKAEYLSPVRAATPVSVLAPPVIPAAASAVQSSGPSPVRAVADLLTQPGQLGRSTATGQEVWAEQGSTNLTKGLRAAAVAIAVVGLVAGAFLLGRRGLFASPVVEVVVAPLSAPVRPVAAPPADAPPVPRIVESTAGSSAAATLSETSAKARDAAQPAGSQSDSASQPAPLRRAVTFGKLAAPVAKRPAISGSSEPPPVLLTQRNATAENMLGTSLLAGTALAPAPPAHSGGQLQEPRLISSSPPIYPAFARAANREGVVVVMDVLVDATGKVAQAKVVSGPIFLERAAIDAMLRWRYQPARLNGQPIAMHMNVNISFTLR